MKVTTYGGIELLRTGGCGAAFELRDPARISTSATDEGWDTEVSKGLKVVVSRGNDATSYHEARTVGAARAQRGLDLMSACGTLDAAIDRPEDLHLVWFPAEQGTVLEIRCVIQSLFRAGIGDGTVTTPNGWHPSFRYWRLAQTGEDLFDGFRNVYLALEALLSDLVSPEGKGEGQWVKEALAAANDVVALAELVAHDIDDPVGHLERYLYKSTRNAVFHAKKGKPVHQPRSEADRAAVRDALRVASDLYVRLSEKLLGVRRQGGGVAVGGFEAMTATVQEMRLGVSDDSSPVDPSSELVNPASGTVVWFDTDEPPDRSTPFEVSTTWTFTPAQVAELDAIRRIVTADHGHPAYLQHMEGELVLGEDIAAVRVTFTHRILSAGDPRTHHPL